MIEDRLFEPSKKKQIYAPKQTAQNAAILKKQQLYEKQDQTSFGTPSTEFLRKLYNMM